MLGKFYTLLMLFFICNCGYSQVDRICINEPIKEKKYVTAQVNKGTSSYTTSVPVINGYMPTMQEYGGSRVFDFRKKIVYDGKTPNYNFSATPSVKNLTNDSQEIFELKSKNIELLQENFYLQEQLKKTIKQEQLKKTIKTGNKQEGFDNDMYQELKPQLEFKIFTVRPSQVKTK